MAAPLTATLRRIGFTLPPNLQVAPGLPAAGFALDGEAEVFEGSNPAPLTTLQVGMGTSEAMQLPALAALGEVSGEAFWFAIGQDARFVGRGASRRPDRPVWALALTGTQLRLRGQQALDLPPINIPGVLVTREQLRLDVTVLGEGSTLQSATLLVQGGCTLTPNLGPLALGALEAAFTLTLQVGSAEALEEALSEPQTLLQRPFEGTLKVVLKLRDLRLAGESLGTQGEATLELAVSGREGRMEMERLSLHVESARTLRLGSVLTLSDLRFDLEAQAQRNAALRVSVSGSGSARPGQALARMVRPVVNQASFVLTQDGAQTHFEVEIPQVQLDSSLNPLGLVGRDLRFKFSRDGVGDWEADLSGQVLSTWSQVARAFSNAGIVSLPNLQPQPAVELVFEAHVGAQTSANMRLRVLEAGFEDRLYDGPVGTLPIRVADVIFQMEAQDDGQLWRWTLGGQGTMSTRRPLSSIVDLRDVELSASVSNGALSLEVAGALAALRLPALRRGDPPLDLITLNRFFVELGQDLRIGGSASLGDISALALRLGGGGELSDFLELLLAPMATGSLLLELPLEGESGLLDLEFKPAGPGADLGDLFKALAKLLPAAGPAEQGVARHQMEQPLVRARIAGLHITATLPDGPLRCSASLACTAAWGDIFDVTLTVTASSTGLQISLFAGETNPILVPIPAPPPLPVPDLAPILQAYKITAGSASEAQVRGVVNALSAAAQGKGDSTLFSFELSRLGLVLDFTPGADPVTLTGGVRLVQLPPLLQELMVFGAPALILGAQSSRFFIEIAAPGGVAPGPLLSIPLSERRNLDIILHNLRFGYVWTSNEFEVKLGMDLSPANLDFQGGIGVNIPNSSISINVGNTVTAPPAPMLDVDLDFTGGLPLDEARRNLGLRFFAGPTRTSPVVTAFLRSFVINPCMFLGMPGGQIDFGLILGRPQDRDEDSAVYFEFIVGGGTVQLINPVVGLLINPLAAIPPFLSPLPPFWVVPGLLMGDLFTDAATGLTMRARIPQVFDCEITFKRPMPSLSLGMMLELAALVAQGFSVPIPQNSELRRMFFARLEGKMKFPLLGRFFGSADEFVLDVEVNLADTANGLIAMGQQVGAVVDGLLNAQQMVTDLFNRPAILVGLIPRERRVVEYSTTLKLGPNKLEFSLRAYMLLGKELLDELRSYHEGVRQVGKGLAAVPPEGEPAPGPFLHLLPVLVEEAQRFRSVVVDHKVFAHAKLRDGAIASNRARLVNDLSARLNVQVESFVAAQRALTPTRSEASIRAELTTPRPIAFQIQPIARSPEYAEDLAFDLVQDRLGLNAPRRLPGPLPLAGGRIEGVTEEESQEINAVLARVRPGLGFTAAAILAAAPAGLGLPGPALPGLPTPGLPTPGLPTPGLPTPGLPTPGLPTPGLPTPGLPTPGLPLPGLPIPGPGLPAPPQPIDPDDAIEQIREILERPVIISRSLPLSPPAAMRAVLEELGRELYPDLPAPPTGLEDRIDRTRIFDGDRFRSRLNPVELGLLPPIDAPTTTMPEGFAIRIRRSEPPIAPDFEVRVDSQATPYTVRLVGGVYVVESQNAAGERLRTPLPAAFVNSTPPGPRRAAALHAGLELVQRLIERPLRPSELEFQSARPERTGDTIYKDSLFFRESEVFDLKPTGGRHGPLSIADLLQAPDGSYLVDAEAVACLVGSRAQVNLLQGHSAVEWNVLFAGLVLTQPEQALPTLLLHGNATQTLVFGVYALQLKGDALIENAGASAKAEFKGEATLTKNGTPLFTGKARASLGDDPNQDTFVLEVDIELDFRIETPSVDGVMASLVCSSTITLGLTIGNRISAEFTTVLMFSVLTPSLVIRDLVVQPPGGFPAFTLPIPTIDTQNLIATELEVSIWVKFDSDGEFSVEFISPPDLSNMKFDSLFGPIGL